MFDDKRIRIITGHYGSGKTEFSVNYAVKLAQEGKKTAIADLDIVNPYFRSREKKKEMEQLGIKVVVPAGMYIHADVPALSSELYALFQDKSYEVVLDVGGDPVGAKILGRFFDYLREGDYDMMVVVNANRPDTMDVQSTVKCIDEIERSARVPATGLINNTHMLRDTTIEDILRGQEVVKGVSKIKNIPVKYISAIEKVAAQLPNDLEGEVFPLKIYMRPEWL